MESDSKGSLSVRPKNHKVDCMCAFCRAFLVSVKKNDTANAALFAKSFLVAHNMKNGAKNGTNGSAAA